MKRPPPPSGGVFLSHGAHTPCYKNIFIGIEMRHCVYISSLHHHVGAITLTLKRSSCIAIPRNSQTFRTAAMSTVSQSSTKIVKCASLMPGFLRWVDHCNNADRLLTPGQSSTPSFTPFQIQDETVGYIDHKYVNIPVSSQYDKHHQNQNHHHHRRVHTHKYTHKYKDSCNN